MNLEQRVSDLEQKYGFRPFSNNLPDRVKDLEALLKVSTVVTELDARVRDLENIGPVKAPQGAKEGRKKKK
jgi:hypothetical protein